MTRITESQNHLIVERKVINTLYQVLLHGNILQNDSNNNTSRKLTSLQPTGILFRFPQRYMYSFGCVITSVPLYRVCRFQYAPPRTRYNSPSPKGSPTVVWSHIRFRWPRQFTATIRGWLYMGLARFPDPACSEKVPELGCPAPFPVPNSDNHQSVPISIVLLIPLHKWNQIAYSLLGLSFLLSTIPFEIRSS